MGHGAASLCSWSLSSPTTGSSPRCPLAYLLKSQMEPKALQDLQVVAKPPAAEASSSSTTVTRGWAGQEAGAPPRTRSARRTRLGCLHSSISKHNEERKEEEKPRAGLGGNPRQFLKPQCWKGPERGRGVKPYCSTDPRGERWLEDVLRAH